MAKGVIYWWKSDGGVRSMNFHSMNWFSPINERGKIGATVVGEVATQKVESKSSEPENKSLEAKIDDLSERLDAVVYELQELHMTIRNM